MLHNSKQTLPSHTPVTKTQEYVSQVAEIALKSFISGKEYNLEMRKKCKDNKELENKYNLDINGYLYLKNEYFPNWAAVCIPGTHFIAAAGPLKYNMENFISDIAYHPHLAMTEIVALGDWVSFDDNDHQDFHDYCLTERKAVYGQYELNIARLNGKSGIVLDNMSEPIGNVQSELTINSKIHGQKKQRITVLRLHDMFAMDLDCPMEVSLSDLALFQKFLGKTSEEMCEERKKLIWEIFEKSLHQYITVHCAGGVGRTGQFILMMLVLMYYEDIFSEESVDKSAAKILDLLKNMREVRPALVSINNQFRYAIINAHIVYQYAVEHELKAQVSLETAEVKASVTPISMFPAQREVPSVQNVVPAAQLKTWIQSPSC